MDNNEAKYKTQNTFFTRGCCGIPDPENPEKAFKPSCAKLDSLNWLKGITPAIDKEEELVEIRFKNSKKDFFKAPSGMGLQCGDIVAVESSPGHDIGIVALTGEVVKLQMKKKRFRTTMAEVKKVYRRARPADVEKWATAVGLESKTMFRTREIANDLSLNMKVNDVEYQGDGTKAVFYYTAEDRVDFRQLIKVLAEEFRIRIEMRQIGARQEAARLGGIGSCGRELCCSTWMTNFTSVTTNNARTQQLSLNPSKLAGQCGKLKCCLNYENAAYREALKEFPSPELVLKSKKGIAEFQKADVFSRTIWYSYKDDFASMMSIPLDSVNKILRMNKKGKMPDKLEEFAVVTEQKTDFDNNLEQDDFYRFDEDNIV